jgi:hypothetical protein
MKLAYDIFFDKWCFALNHPTDEQVEDIIERIINNRKMSICNDI